LPASRASREPHFSVIFPFQAFRGFAMNWMTITWPMVAAVCLTLGLIELRIGVARPVDVARLLFSLSAFATAGECGCELALMHAASPAQFQVILHWADALIVLMLSSLAGFIWAYFRSGNKWLALAVPCLGCVALVPDLLPGGADTIYLEITSLKTVQTLGSASYRVAEGRPNPWNAFVYLSVLMLFVFVVDASVRLARRGGVRRAVIIGGSVAVWLLVSSTHSALIESGIARMPYIISVSYLLIVLAMSYELTSDVSAAAKIGRELRDSERRMDLASAAAGLGMWTWDLNNRTGWASARTQRLLGYSDSEHLTQARFMDAVHPDDREGVRLAVERAMTSDHDFEMEHRVQVRGVETRWVTIRGRVERNDSGKPILVRGVLLDISSRRRSEMELVRLHSQLTHTSRVTMMGQLATALAHELHQPLGAILRNTEAAELFLDHDPPDLSELRAILIDIRADDKRAREVIDRLRALLKRRSVESRALALTDVLANIAALTRAETAARSITMEIESGFGLPSVMGDGVHLQQVLLNLVLNAMDAIDSAASKERLVTVRAQQRNGQDVEIAVSDTGPGIAPGDIALIFDPFFTTKASGMGIGLSVSRTIIEAHGGRIWAENNMTKGATFRFTLPTEETVMP
jgi:two-component system sensor kinase FixL